MHRETALPNHNILLTCLHLNKFNEKKTPIYTEFNTQCFIQDNYYTLNCNLSNRNSLL